MTDPCRIEAERLLEDHLQALRDFVRDTRAGKGPTQDRVKATREAVLRPMTDGLHLKGTRQ